MEKINSSKYSNLIVRDRYFLIIDNKDNRRFCTINMRTVKLAKKIIDLTFFNEKEINSFWEVENFPYKQIKHAEFFNENLFENEEIDYSNEKIIKNTNKEIYSDGKAQKYTEVEIRELKESGMTGNELIKTIIEGNSSMEKRTIFSQEKILKKKDKKHKHLIWIAPTNLFNIIETFFLTDMNTIKFLRIDSVSTMLVNSSFLNNANTLIYDETNNIITSAYASRSSIKANIVSLFETKLKTKNLMLFNLKRKSKDTITYLDINYLINKNSFYYLLFARKYLSSFKNLVIFLKNEKDMLTLILQLFDYLAYSGNVIVFSREIEYLVALEKLLLDNKLAIDTRIHETILREYQALPLRFHPTMNNKGFSGYVFTAIKVLNK